MSHLIPLITSPNADVRDQALDAFARAASRQDLLAECEALEDFRQRSGNLYERVRALFFLYAIHRFHLPGKEGVKAKGLVPFEGYAHLLSRRFEEAIACFLSAQKTDTPNEAVCSALAEAYHKLAFQTLADQVRRSVRSVRGNQWMFRIGHPADQPLRVRRELIQHEETKNTKGNSSDFLRSSFLRVSGFPILRERTPVRMDLSHSAWSDIFFLGMDFPEGARVLNISIDLGVHGRDAEPKPPVEAYIRVIDEPVLRLTSVDLGATADIAYLSEVFDFAKDYLGLLKAAIIASGIVPPGIEGCPDVRDGSAPSRNTLQELLERLTGLKNHGLELISNVNDIPKGSRLAVSTNLLASLISVCMRATGQAKSLTGTLQESERRLVAARAILGEWLAGSGGGWQDSGGVWPAMKLIEGQVAQPGDVEFGISRGRLLPGHKILTEHDAPQAVRQHLQDSLILVHGGMAQNVGPILEMVTEKYLLRSEAEWRGRQEALGVLDEILLHLKSPTQDAAHPMGRTTDTASSVLRWRSAVQKIAEATTRNFFGPIQTIIPWASTAYTEALIDKARGAFGEKFWGFWMLGGMSGGGMGFIVAPEIKAEAQAKLQTIMRETKREMQRALPFAMEPVVYDFAINPHGTFADMLDASDAPLPVSYYGLHVPMLAKQDRAAMTPSRRAELDQVAAAARTNPAMGGLVQRLFDRLLPRIEGAEGGARHLPSDGGHPMAGAWHLNELLGQNGFDREQHEQIRADLKSGKIGLSQNRLAANTTIQDVRESDVIDATSDLPAHYAQMGAEAIRGGQVAVFSLAAGAGSRWTQGAGVVKALHPFSKLGGKHRSFIEVHLAKTRKVARTHGVNIPHIFTTSYATHDAIAAYVANPQSLIPNPHSPISVILSPGASVGLRMIPMARDLRFAWEEMPQQVLDEQKQKMRESGHAALIGWAQASALSGGEGSDYTDNVPMQCLHPVGHWFEVPNLLRNGVLAKLLNQRPQLRYLMLHNIDTLGASIDPTMLGLHMAQGSCLSFEVITRRIDDRGGGLARVDGRARLVEGLAMPHERDEFMLSYYNSMTTWIDIDQLLAVFGLRRDNLSNEPKVIEAIRRVGARMPTYITLKDVKKRWGHGQEDIFPVAQFEKLWSDMTALPEVSSSFIVVPRMRGAQLKDQAQLDGWLRDGSAAYVEGLCEW
jgi:hypothetical protein